MNRDFVSTVLGGAAGVAVAVGMATAGTAQAASTVSVKSDGTVVITDTLPAARWACIVEDFGKGTNTTFGSGSTVGAGETGPGGGLLSITTKKLSDGKHTVRMACTTNKWATTKLLNTNTVYVGALAGLYESLDKTGSSSLVP